MTESEPTYEDRILVWKALCTEAQATGDWSKVNSLAKISLGRTLAKKKAQNG